MDQPIVFMFSGQGSQYYQMGKELYENHPRFKLWMDHCDEIVQPLLQTSLIDILYQESHKRSLPFEKTEQTNPALLCIEYSLTRILMEMDIQPHYLLGYSLGEVTACVISGALALEDGIEWVVDFAKLIEQGTPPASMLAILESVDIMTQFPTLFQHCWLTGKNFPKNFVVSGLPEHIQALQHGLNQQKILFKQLPVRCGFHTPLLDPLEARFKQLSQHLSLASPTLPMISSSLGGLVQEIDDDYFWEVIRHPVDFEKTLHILLQHEDCMFIDVGPSGSLATFVKYLLPPHSKSRHMEVLNPFGKDLQSLEKLKRQFLS